jgi:NAD(P)-dependent dehydrogenase (short-subunit alcohol dehydrogenase family)
MPCVLITGAGRGIGLELARQYAGAGWRVIATIRDPAQGRALPGSETHLLDVTDAPAVKRLAVELRGTPIDVLLCNAGIGSPGDVVGALDAEKFTRVLQVNTIAPLALAEAFVDHVAASEMKLMVMVSNRMGSIAQASGGRYAYRASKAALNMVVKALSSDLAPRAIRVIALHPGWVRTDMGTSAAQLSPEESVSGLRRVIAGLKAGDSGRFLTHEGVELPW